MMHRAEERVAENVILVVVYYRRAVRKLNDFMAADFEIYGVEICFDGEGGVPRPSIRRKRWSLEKYVRNRRLVAYLLEEYHGSIGQLSLIGFTEYWIQRLIPRMATVEERETCDYHKFHSLSTNQPT